MKMEAFGEIGLLPSDFFRMRYKDYLLLQSGFANGRVYYRKVLRRVVKNLLEPYVKQGKSISEYQIWPEPGDADEMKQRSAYISEKNAAKLKQFKERERLQGKPDQN